MISVAVNSNLLAGEGYVMFLELLVNKGLDWLRVSSHTGRSHCLCLYNFAL